MGREQRDIPLVAGAKTNLTFKMRHEIEYVDPKALKAFPGNAKRHPDAQIAALKRSIQEFGFTAPVLADKNNLLIAGHGRIQAAIELGLAEVPLLRVTHFTDAQKRAYVIADNKLTEMGEWDEELLATELQALLEAGVDLRDTGMSDDETRRLLGALGASAGLTDPDDAPPVQSVSVSRPGDIWSLGRHRIVCGSSTDAATVQALLGGCKPHLMVTDPPYGVDYDPAWRARAGHGSAGQALGTVLNDDRADWREAWDLFPGSVAYVWHGGLHAAIVADSLAASRFEMRAQVVWVKTRPVFGRGHYHWQHEPCYVDHRDDGDAATGGEPTEHELAVYAVRTGQTGHWAGSRKQSTVWMIEHLRSDTGHGTQKPVECMRRPIENNSGPGDFVYEPFSGSGTTIIACEMTGRSCMAAELNPAYVDVAIRRWQEFTGKRAVSESGAEFGA